MWAKKCKSYTAKYGTYLSGIESKNQTKQTRRSETESWVLRAFQWLPDGKGSRGTDEEERGLSTNR